MPFELIISVIAFFVVIGSGYFRFKNNQYQTCFDISSSFAVFFLFLYLNYTLDWNWLCSMALPIAIYTVVIVIVKKIATRGGENRDA